MTRNILVVAAHPDDEALGCGGTMARHSADGDIVHALFMTDGVGARGDDLPDTEDDVARNLAADQARKILGAAHYEYLRFPDNMMDTVPLLSIAQAIERYAETFTPDVVYTHFGGDLNVDHMVTQRAVMTAFRPAPGTRVKTIRAFEVMSSTEWAFGTTSRDFRPQVFVDIADHLEQKLKALDAYHMEMRAFPHTRSIASLEHLARLRGSQVGLDAAETFEVIRDIDWS